MCVMTNMCLHRALCSIPFTLICNMTTFRKKCFDLLTIPHTPIPLDGASATIRNVGQNDANPSRNGKSIVEVQ